MAPQKEWSDWAGRTQTGYKTVPDQISSVLTGLGAVALPVGVLAGATKGAKAIGNYRATRILRGEAGRANDLLAQERLAQQAVRGRSPIVVAAEEMQALKAGTASPIRFVPPTAGPGIPLGPIGSTSLGPIPMGPIPGYFPGGLPASEIAKIRATGNQISSELAAGQNMGSVLTSGVKPNYYPGAYTAQEVNNIRALGAQTQAELAAGQNMGAMRSMAYNPVAQSVATAETAGGIPLMPAQALQAEQAAAAGAGDPIATFLAEEAARRGGAAESAGLLARLGFGGEGAAGTTGLSQFIRAGLTPRAALGRVAGGATIGQLGASYIVDPLNIGGKNSAWDRFATGATFGAGLGAGIGNVIPIPGVGAGIGAATGAVLGGTANMIKGWFDDRGMTEVSKKNQQRYLGLADLMDTAGLNERQKATLQAQYETGLKLVGDDTQAQSDLLGRMEQSIMGLAGTNPYSLTGKDLIGLQTEIAKYMQPLQERMTSSNAGVTAAYNQIASQMSNQQLADSARLMGAQAQANADNMNLAIARAATMAPMNYAYTLDKMQPQSSGSSSGTDLSSLLANAGG